MKQIKNKTRKKVFKIGDQIINPGEVKRVELEVASLYDFTPLSIPVEVIRGKEEGPILFISAAVHGDEINGVEIIRRLKKKKVLKQIKGTLLLIPVVNIFGFNHKSRYLPDRRDLNRSFPGSKNGSLASQMANIFMKEIVKKSTHGIDLHTASIHKTNLPQVRASLDNEETLALAKSFGAEVVVHSKLRDGSLREAARTKKVKTLLFEGGEALRFNENVIKIGVKGCLNVMRQIGMLDEKEELKTKTKKKVSSKNEPTVIEKSSWVRAMHSGIFRTLKHSGDYVVKGEVIARITDPLGDQVYEVKSDEDGIIIGHSQIPLVNKGDAMFHIGKVKSRK